MEHYPAERIVLGRELRMTQPLVGFSKAGAEGDSYRLTRNGVYAPNFKVPYQAGGNGQQCIISPFGREGVETINGFINQSFFTRSLLAWTIIDILAINWDGETVWTGTHDPVGLWLATGPCLGGATIYPVASGIHSLNAAPGTIYGLCSIGYNDAAMKTNYVSLTGQNPPKTVVLALLRTGKCISTLAGQVTTGFNSLKWEEAEAQLVANLSRTACHGFASQTSQMMYRFPVLLVSEGIPTVGGENVVYDFRIRHLTYRWI